MRYVCIEHEPRPPNPTISREVVGCAMTERFTGGLTLDVLDMAYQQRKPPPGLIHHSDRGGQYTSSAYHAKLKRIEARPITNRHSLANAFAERFFAPFITEGSRLYDSKVQAKLCIFAHLEVFYNQQRRHSSPGFLSPSKFEEQALNLIELSAMPGQFQDFATRNSQTPSRKPMDYLMPIATPKQPLKGFITRLPSSCVSHVGEKCEAMGDTPGWRNTDESMA